ncbi:MAG: type II secretion system F family protein [Candidatus Bathyarchaeia archaeon]
MGTFSLIDRARRALQSRSIEADLPYLLSMLSAMSEAGMDMTEALLNLKDEKTFSKPTRRLLSSMITESKSEPLSVVLNERSKHYGGWVGSFLSGLAVEMLKGDVNPYLESFTSKLVERKLGEMGGSISTEEVMSIAYSTVFILGPMVFLVVLSALDYLSTPILPLTGWFCLLFLLFVPIGTSLFTTLGWKRGPVSKAMPFVLVSIIFLYVGMFLEHEPASDSILPLAGLIFLPLGVHETASWLREQSIDRHLPTFLRDLSLQLASGRDFLQTFRSLAKERYGDLSRVLQRIVNAMELGEPFANSIQLLSHETTLSTRVVNLIRTLMRGGGDVSKIAETVSTFSWRLHLIEVEKSRRQSLTVIFFYIFMGVFFFLASSTLQILSTGAPMVVGDVPPTTFIERILFRASMISAICAGLVAGVMTTGRIGVGGIHVFSFTVMSVLFYYWVW